MKKQGLCIFCGGKGMSKEHIWSDWLKEYVPQSKKHSRNFTRFEMVTPTTLVVNPLFGKEKNGDFSQRKVRKVCTNCNNGWMSKIVQDAKPCLLGLINGDELVLDKKALDSLFCWATLSFMMAEFTDEEFRRIPNEELNLFYSSREPLDSWTFLLGRYGDSNAGPIWYRHVGIDIMEVKFPRLTPAQLSTVVIGEFVLIGFSSPSDLVNSKFREHSTKSKLSIVFPCQSDMVSSKLLGVLSYTDVLNESDSFLKLMS